MSDEEKKDLGDKANDAMDSAKETAKEFAEEAKETAGEFKDAVNEITDGGENKKVLIGVLAIVLGSFGIHKFLLGYQKEGIIMAAITVVGYATSCLVIGIFFLWIPAVIGLVEGIIYLTKSDEEFYNTYQIGKRPWF